MQEISKIIKEISVSRECSVVAGADTRSGTRFNQLERSLNLPVKTLNHRFKATGIFNF